MRLHFFNLTQRYLYTLIQANDKNKIPIHNESFRMFGHF